MLLLLLDVSLVPYLLQQWLTERHCRVGHVIIWTGNKTPAVLLRNLGLSSSSRADGLSSLGAPSVALAMGRLKA